MDKWFKDILPDKDPYHNRGRDQMSKKGGPPELDHILLNRVHLVMSGIRIRNIIGSHKSKTTI
jgi:hypothetical protein